MTGDPNGDAAIAARYPITSDDHALRTGMAFGYASQHGLDPVLIDDPNGEPCAAFRVPLPDVFGVDTGSILIVVEP